MKPSITIYTIIILLSQLRQGSTQCTAKTIYSKRFFSCIYTSVYSPVKKPITLNNGNYRNVSVVFTSSYIPTLSGNIMTLTSGYILTSLSITRSKLNSIRGDTFTSFSRLEYLDLSNNNLSSLANDMFNTSTYLKTLNVSHNNISMFGSETFYRTPLLNFDLSYNKLAKIGNAEFKDLHFIKSLNLSNNLIKVIDLNVFEGAINLVDLNLKGNLIHVLPNCLMHLSLLRKLDLSNNNISSLSQDVFTGLISLMELDISFNNLETVPWMVFKETPVLIAVNIQGNRFSYEGYKLQNFPAGLSVKNVTLGQNKIPCEQLLTLLKMLKSVGLHVMQKFDEFEEVNIFGIACTSTRIDKSRASESVKASKMTDLSGEVVSKIKINLIIINFLLVVLVVITCVQLTIWFIYGRGRLATRNISLGILEN